MYKKQLDQAYTFFAFAARAAANFLYFGYHNSQTLSDFKDNFNMGMRHFDDASYYGHTPSVDDFVAQTLGKNSHSDIVTMLDYNSA